MADLPVPVHPLAPFAQGAKPRSRGDLRAVLRRIDGWGPLAWREVHGAWRLGHGVLVIEGREAGTGARDGADDDDAVAVTLIVPHVGLGRAATTGADARVAACDWVLRRAWTTLLAAPAIRATTARPPAWMVATNACTWLPASSGDHPALALRLNAWLPFAGMCCDARPFARFVRALDVFAADLAARRRRPGLDAHLRAQAVQRALRAALPAHGLIAFIADGALLARAADDRPAAGCRPFRVPRRLRATIDLGPLGRFHGLGLRQGITAVAGAPYHGKSTLLAAIAAGRYDHPPGDGRDAVVSDDSALAVQAEDGRRIKDQDVSGFFARLPGADVNHLATGRASGATSMAASVLQGVAAGCRLLLIDEDSAASNFLAVDPGMRRLIGRAASGNVTLIDALPGLARQGVSTVLVAGSHLASLAQADRVVLMHDFQPGDATRRARRLIARRPPDPVRDLPLPRRLIRDQPDCLFGHAHFLAVDVREPERPRIAGEVLDLRRCGWSLDPAVVRGAVLAAAWCCRLAAGRPVPLAELRRTLDDFLAERGVRGLDPYDSQFVALPPWQLVVAVLERLPRPALTSGAR